MSVPLYNQRKKAIMIRSKVEKPFIVLLKAFSKTLLMLKLYIHFEIYM